MIVYIFEMFCSFAYPMLEYVSSSIDDSGAARGMASSFIEHYALKTFGRYAARLVVEEREPPGFRLAFKGETHKYTFK